MIRQIFTVAAAVLLAPAAQSHGQSEVPETVNWTIAPDDDDDSAQIQFTISYRTANSRSTWSNTTPVAELQGLDPVQLASDGGTPVQFGIRREAGRFDCSGIVRRRSGAGECSFEGDPAFAAALARRGIGMPGRSEQYQLALARVEIALLDELDREHYQRPSVDDLVAAGIHGVTPDYVRSMSRAGHNVGTVDGLVAMRIHGVTPDFVDAMAAAGYRPDADTLVALRIHGATPEYIRAVGRAGGGRYSAEDLIAMRIHGVTEQYVGELNALGYRNLSADDLTSLRIHGVTTEFVRELAELGYAGLSADDLTSMRIHDVTTAFVRRELAERTSRPSADELVSLRIHGER